MIDLLQGPLGLLLGLAALGGLVFGIVGALTNGASGAHQRRENRALEAQRDSAAIWAHVRDVPQLQLGRGVSDPRRLLLGYLRRTPLWNPPLRSMLVLAPTGQGKTPRIVVPHILRHEGPVLATSVKNDVLQLTHERRAGQGPVWIIDPLDSSGRSARWSPLQLIHSWADALDATRWIQECSKVEGRSQEDQQFWDAQSRYMLAPLLFLAAQRERSMSDVATLVANVEARTQEVRRHLADIGEQGPIDDWAAFCSINDRTRSSIVTTARTVLEAWAHPRARRVINARAGEPGTLDIDEFLESQGTLYLVCPSSEQAQFSAIFETLVNATLIAVERRYHYRGAVPLDPPLLLCLDEAANIAPLRKLDQVASEKAGQGVILVSVWQDEGQVVKIYGQDRARTIIANHTAKIYLPGIQDDETLRKISQQIGQFWVESSQFSSQYERLEVGPRSRSISTSMQMVDVAPPSKLRQLGPNEAIVLTGSCKPIRLTLRGWFEDPELRALVPGDIAERFDAQFASSQSRKRISR